MRFGFLLAGHCYMQICKLLFRICVAAVKTTTTRRRQHGGKCFTVWVFVCTKAKEAQHRSQLRTCVCVCVRECMCRCSDIRNRIRLKFTTEKITVEVSQRFGREYVSFINSFFFRFKRRFSNFDLRFHFTSRNVITIYCHSQNTQNGYFKSDQIY